jgi:hypothetical protein
MLLYHGTNGAWLANIMKRGLRPRGQSAARNNWRHVALQSNAACVYLTNCYAPYFAFNAARGKSPTCAVVEIDSDLLPDPKLLLPDEDSLEQAGRGHDDVPGNMSQRILHYRRILHQWIDTRAWEASLEVLGTCAYAGSIPPQAITRAVAWPHTPNIRLALVWDPTITVMNQRIMGPSYRELTRRLFAAEFTPLDAYPGLSLDERRAALPPIDSWQLFDNRTREVA